MARWARMGWSRPSWSRAASPVAREARSYQTGDLVTFRKSEKGRPRPGNWAPRRGRGRCHRHCAADARRTGKAAHCAPAASGSRWKAASGRCPTFAISPTAMSGAVGSGPSIARRARPASGSWRIWSHSAPTPSMPPPPMSRSAGPEPAGPSIPTAVLASPRRSGCGMDAGRGGRQNHKLRDHLVSDGLHFTSIDAAGGDHTETKFSSPISIIRSSSTNSPSMIKRWPSSTSSRSVDGSSMTPSSMPDLFLIISLFISITNSSELFPSTWISQLPLHRLFSPSLPLLYTCREQTLRGLWSIRPHACRPQQPYLPSQSELRPPQRRIDRHPNQPSRQHLRD